MKKLFYSNCFIEALKAKLKDWKNIKVIRIPKWLNCDILTHFCWLNIKENKIYEFNYEKDLPKCLIFFRGYINSFDKDVYEDNMNTRMTYFAKKIEKKFKFKTKQTKYEHLKKVSRWQTYLNDDEITPDMILPYQEECPDKDNRVLCLVQNEKNELSMKFLTVNADRTINLNEGDTLKAWRYWEKDSDDLRVQYERNGSVFRL